MKVFGVHPKRNMLLCLYYHQDGPTLSMIGLLPGNEVTLPLLTPRWPYVIYDWFVTRYRGYHKPPTDANPYGYTMAFWHVLAAQLAFVVVFEVWS